jgi:hypothetical protein
MNTGLNEYRKERKRAMTSEYAAMHDWACGAPDNVQRAVLIAHSLSTDGYKYTEAYPTGMEYAGYQILRELIRLGLREDRLVKLHDKICNYRNRYLVALLRAEHLGIITATQLNKAIDEDEPLDLKAILAEIVLRFPYFGRYDNIPA